MWLEHASQHTRNVSPRGASALGTCDHLHAAGVLFDTVTRRGTLLRAVGTLPYPGLVLPVSPAPADSLHKGTVPSPSGTTTTANNRNNRLLQPSLNPYPVPPNPALPYPTLPYPTLPYPYPTQPYPTLPYPTLCASAIQAVGTQK
jgi:hypothetical protein